MVKYLNQQHMKDSNMTNVFKLIRKEKHLTKRQIESITGLSWGAVSNVTARLSDLAFIKETAAKEHSGAGRTPIFLEVNDNDHFIIGVDVNISGFRGVLMNLKNDILFSAEEKFCGKTKKEIIENIINLIRKILQNAGNADVLCVGIAMQGLVDTKAGISHRFADISDWDKVTLSYILQEELNMPVFLQHDPECILYAHSSMTETKESVLLRIDNGIGMSLMLDGKIAERFGAYEIGHTVIIPEGEKCPCGKNGCLERYVSISGLESLSGEDISTLTQKAKTNSEAKAYFSQMAKYLAGTVLNIAHLFNVQDVVFCGDIFKYKDLFLEDLLKNLTVYDKNHQLNFVETEVKHAATGAAMIASERYMNEYVISQS